MTKVICGFNNSLWEMTEWCVEIVYKLLNTMLCVEVFNVCE